MRPDEWAALTVREQANLVREKVAEHPDDEELAKLLEDLDRVLQANPLEGFAAHKCAQCETYTGEGCDDHRVPQVEFLEAWTQVVALFAGNQFGKCQKMDTPVRMADGSVKAIGDIREGEWVVGVNLDGTTRPARVIEWIDQGVKDVYEHVFSKRGVEASFAATADHKMLARPESGTNRIVPAGDVRERWVAQRQLGFDPGPSDDPDEEHATLIGLLLGDGCLTRSSPQFTCADPDIRILAEIEAERIGCHLRGHTSNPIQFYLAQPSYGQTVTTANPVKRLAKRLGFDCYAHEKHIPEQAWGWGNAAVARLLAGLLLSDGSVKAATPRADGNHGSVRFDSTSRHLVQGVRDLMEQRFGIYGSPVREHHRPDKKRTEYSWAVANYAGLSRLQQHIPLVGVKRDRLDQLLANWKGKVSDGAGLRFREHRYLGRHQTCDITIDHPTHLFALANGLVVSNTASLVIRAILECLPDELVPQRLRRFKRRHGPTFGWILAPTEEKVYDSILPTFKEWMPIQAYKGGSFDKAWNGSRMMLTFVNGSYISFKTYKQHESTLGGARLMFVGYDEPPPQAHRDEAMTRLLRYGGYEMFAMTPLKTNTGWIRRDIFKQRESPDITVIRASMHDNPLLDKKAKKHIIASYASDLWRQAREFGDFVDVGGLIYQDYLSAVRPRPTGDTVRLLDPVVGIDPGARNAAFIFGGFDNDNTLTVFDELLIQDGTVDLFVKGIDERLNRWGVKRDQVSFVIDPAFRARGGPNYENLDSAFAAHGIYVIPGQNAVEAGIQQVRSRIENRRLRISNECRHLLDEMDEYAAEDRDDGEFKPVKINDHHCDALRYLAMYRPYDHVGELHAAEPKLGWRPGHAPPMSALMPQPDLVPNGFLS